MNKNISELKTIAISRGIQLNSEQKYSKGDLITILQDWWIETHNINLDKEHGLRMRLELDSPMLCFQFNKLNPEEQNTLLTSSDWGYEEKFDGCRIIVTYHPAEGVRYWGRNLSIESFLPIEYTDKILMCVKSLNALFSSANGSATYPGEWYKDKWRSPFMLDTELLPRTPEQLDTSVVRKNGEKAKTGRNAVATLLSLDADDSKKLQETQCHLYLMVFDLMIIDGINVMDRSFIERRKYLESSVKKLELNMDMELSDFCDDDSLWKFLNGVLSSGGEGVVFKYKHAPYINRNTRPREAQVKLKKSAKIEKAYENLCNPLDLNKIIMGEGEDIDAFIIGYVDATEGKKHANNNLIGGVKLGVFIHNPKRQGYPPMEHHIATVSSIPDSIRNDMTIIIDGKPCLKKEYYRKVVVVDGMDISPVNHRLSHAKINWDIGIRDDKGPMECYMDYDYVFPKEINTYDCPCGYSYHDGVTTCKKCGKEKNMNQIFVMSAGDMDSILAAKIIALKYNAIHLASNRKSFDHVPDGSLLYIVRPFTGVRRLLELARRFNVVIYDVDIAEEYKDVELLKAKGCDCHYCPSSLTVSEMVWRNEHPESKTYPQIVKIVRDYMRWELQLDESFPVHYALDIETPKFGNAKNELYSSLLNGEGLDTLVKNGTEIQKYLDTMNANLCKELAFESKIGEVTVLCANAPGVSSQFFTAKTHIDHYDVAMAFGYIPNSGKVRCSLYAIDPEVDVSLIAKQFNGGGHKGAAGFTSNSLPFDRFTGTDNKPDWSYLDNDERLSPAVINYLHQRIHGFQSRAFYGKYRGKDAVFYNSPYLTPTPFFSQIKTGGCEVGVQFCMTSNGMYRVASTSLTDEQLPEDYGELHGNYRIEYGLGIMSEAIFNQVGIDQDIFWKKDSTYT